MTKDEIDYAVDRCPDLMCYDCPAYIGRMGMEKPSLGKWRSNCVLKDVFYNKYGADEMEMVTSSRIQTTHKEFFYQALLDPLYEDLRKVKEADDGHNLERT